jgi:hypothetical protein
MFAVVMQGKDALAPMDGMDALMEAVALENQRSRPLPDEDFDDDEMEPSTAGSPLGKFSLSSRAYCTPAKLMCCKYPLPCKMA